MRQSDIEIGTTYLFMATDNPTRKHLEGKPFKVTDKRAVFRKFKGKGTRKTWRFFNADGIGARASELGELSELPELSDAGLITCPHCKTTDKADQFEGGKCPECGEEAGPQPLTRDQWPFTNGNVF